MRNKIIIGVCFLALVIGLIINYTKDVGMSDNWIGPYLSGAANYEIGGTFLTNHDQVIEFKELVYQDQLAYRFTRSPDTEYYNHNPIGFAIIIAISKLIFGTFFGDMQSFIFLQLLLHLVISVYFLKLFKKESIKFYSFMTLYALNPFIIYFAVFNFYYFWQVIPSVLLLLLLLKPKLLDNLSFNLASGVILGLLFLTRPTLIGISLVFFVLLFLYQRKKIYSISSFCVSILLIITLHSPNQKSPWHSVYVGLGAYENPYQITLSDNEAYSYHGEVTGVVINASYGGNYYDKDLIIAYNHHLRTFIFNAVNENPGIFIRNAFLNYGQSFFIGYKTRVTDWVNIGLSVLGYLLLIFSLYTLNREKFFLLLAITFYSLTYIVFFPPIQAYHYGAYILIIILLILNFEDGKKLFKKSTVSRFSLSSSKNM